AASSGCDPRRSRRAGATPASARSGESPTPCCDPRRSRRAGATGLRAATKRVALERCDPRRSRRAGATRHFSALFSPSASLRSSPVPSGRRHHTGYRLGSDFLVVAILAGPVGPPPLYATFLGGMLRSTVAILAGPVGPAPRSTSGRW